MKTPRNQLAGRRAFGSGRVATATLLLLAALPVAAATTTTHTATGWIAGAPLPGVWCTNALGQVLFRGNAHLVRVQSSDPRLTGQRLIFVDGAAQTDGSAIIYGTAYQEVGAWDLADPQNPKFTPTGGLWETTHRGVMQADNSLQLNIVGYGSGGTIDGLRVEETLTRAACPTILDPTCPYHYAGTIKPPPVSASEVLDNFDDNKVTGWTLYGSARLIETNQQFTVQGHWPGERTTGTDTTMGFAALSESRTIGDGWTLEWRFDLIGLDDNAINAVKVVFGTTSGLYGFFLGRDFVLVGKWHGAPSVFSFDKAPVGNTNRVIAFAMTRVGSNIILTARVLDKNDPNVVLYQRSVVDTPQADPTLTTAEVEALSGMRLTSIKDTNGTPYMSGSIGLGLWQYTDGNQPAAEVTFDNLELRTYEVPLVGIERAVAITWPGGDGLNYSVEGAPTIQGPWLPVADTPIPVLRQLTVPANGFMEFFRLRQVP